MKKSATNKHNRGFTVQNRVSMILFILLIILVVAGGIWTVKRYEDRAQKLDQLIERTEEIRKRYDTMIQRLDELVEENKRLNKESNQMLDELIEERKKLEKQDEEQKDEEEQKNQVN